MIDACSTASYSPFSRAYSASCCFVPPKANNAGEKVMSPTAMMPASFEAAWSSRDTYWIALRLARRSASGSADLGLAVDNPAIALDLHE
jgi:hypothetical protein